MALQELDITRVRRWCAARVSEPTRHQVRVECEIAHDTSRTSLTRFCRGTAGERARRQGPATDSYQGRCLQMGHRQRPRQRMHAALDIREAALPMADPVEAYSVTHNALGSAIKVIARADDSSGIIGDACRRLLELHPKVAAAAHVAAAKTHLLDDDVPVRRLALYGTSGTARVPTLWIALGPLGQSITAQDFSGLTRRWLCPRRWPAA